MQISRSSNFSSVYLSVPAEERSWPLGSHRANSGDVPGNVLRRKANIQNLNSKCSLMEPKLTSENHKFCEDRHELVVFYPTSGLKLVPQSSQGFRVQINFCETKKRDPFRRWKRVCLEWRRWWFYREQKWPFSAASASPRGEPCSRNLPHTPSWQQPQRAPVWRPPWNPDLQICLPESSGYQKKPQPNLDHVLSGGTASSLLNPYVVT